MINSFNNINKLSVTYKFYLVSYPKYDGLIKTLKTQDFADINISCCFKSCNK